MTEKSQKKGDGKRKLSTSGLSPVAKALLKETSMHLNLDGYGNHADMLGVGATWVNGNVEQEVVYAKS